MKAKGFTLLEVMIATTIALFVAAAGQTFFTSSFNFSVLHGRNLEMQRESRVALDLISREIRNGGVGLRNPFKRSAVFPIVGALQTIIPGNNLDPDPSGVAAKLDRITVQTVQQIGRLTCGAGICTDPVVVVGDNAIFVAPTPGMDLADPTLGLVGRMITLEGFYTATVTAVAGPNGNGSYTLILDTNNNAITRPFSQNNGVLWIQQVLYNVALDAAGQPVLFRSINGAPGQALASGIEDLQFAYLMSDGLVINSPAAAAAGVSSDIRAVRIGIVARAMDPAPSATAVSTRPALEDHAGAAAPDRFHRRLIQKFTEVRSLAY